jgi:hypothetical protein
MFVSSCFKKLAPVVRHAQAAATTRQDKDRQLYYKSVLKIKTTTSIDVSHDNWWALGGGFIYGLYCEPVLFS